MSTARSSCAALLILTASVALLVSGMALPAAAQESRAEMKRSEPGEMMRERAYRRFESIVSLYGDRRYAEALAAAETYLGSELNDHERAMGRQLHGYILLALDRPAEAVPSFEAAVALDALSNEAHFSLMRSLAQLYASLERWEDTIELVNRYLRYRAEPASEDQIMMAQSYVQLGRYREALPWVRGAIATGAGQAQESWFQLELAILFELEDYHAALGVLHAVVARWPDRLRYWEMLAGANQALERDLDAFSALMAAYNGGLITEPTKILNLVRTSLYVDLPYQGGQILNRAIEAGDVEANPANLRLLLQSWTAAREYERAVAVIDRLAPLAGEGDLYMQKARLMMEQSQWQATIDGARQALELGNVSSRGAAWLIVGIASMELGQLREARDAFQRAQEFDPASRRQAREWQRFVEDRIRVSDLRAER